MNERLKHVPGIASSRKVLSVAACVALLAAAVASAGVARSWGPLAGIRAADHSAEPADAIPSGVAAQIRADELPAGTRADSIGKRLIGQARLLGALPDGRLAYGVPSSEGKLCVVVASLAESCSNALSHERPITLSIFHAGPGAAPLLWGAATDEVVAVAFTVGGDAVTVPVHKNFFAWEGSPNESGSSISAATVTFADGSSELAS